MWKSKYCGQDVAVKVIRTYSNTNLQRVVGVSRSFTLFPRLNSNNQCHYVEILQGGCDMENPAASEYSTSDRGNHDRNPVCDGLRLDGKWKHQRIYGK